MEKTVSEPKCKHLSLCLIKVDVVAKAAWQVIKNTELSTHPHPRWCRTDEVIALDFNPKYPLKQFKQQSSFSRLRCQAFQRVSLMTHPPGPSLFPVFDRPRDHRHASPFYFICELSRNQQQIVSSTGTAPQSASWAPSNPPQQRIQEPRSMPRSTRLPQRLRRWEWMCMHAHT
jgi:hypothetical protein